MEENKQEYAPTTTFDYVHKVMIIGNYFKRFIDYMGQDFFDEIEKSQTEKYGKTIHPKWYLAYGRFETMLLSGDWPKNQKPINTDDLK